MKLKHSTKVNGGHILEEGNMDIIHTMTNVLKFQQQGAIDLTRLVLEHAQDNKVTKDYVFQVFTEAMDILKDQLREQDEDE